MIEFTFQVAIFMSYSLSLWERFRVRAYAA